MVLSSCLPSRGTRCLLHLQTTWLHSSKEEENAGDNTNTFIYTSKTVTWPRAATMKLGKSRCFVLFLWLFNRAQKERKTLCLGTGSADYTTACHCLTFQMSHLFLVNLYLYICFYIFIFNYIFLKIFPFRFLIIFII